MKRCITQGLFKQDSFYGQHAPERMPTSYSKSKWDAWIQCGCSVGNGCAAVFTVSNALGAKAGNFIGYLDQERKT